MIKSLINGAFSKNYIRSFHDTDLFEQIFERYLEITIKNHSILFIDSTHIKANVNKNKYINQVVKKDTLTFQEKLEK